MNERLGKICERYIKNREIVRSTFRLESQALYSICAAQLTGHGKQPQSAELKEARKILKRETGLFSSFRGEIELPALTALVTAPDAELRMKQITEMYKILKEEFFGSTYLALAAMLLPELVPGESARPYIARGKGIFQMMKEEHPFLTSSEDSVLAILLSFSEKSDEQLIRDMEQVYSFLKARIKWSDSESMQTVSHILAMGETPAQESAERFLKIFERLNEAGHAYGKDYQLTALAVLAISGQEIDAITQDILEVDAFLSEQEGYRSVIGCDKKTRLMHAAMLVTLADDKSALPDAGILTSTLVMIAAQQAAMCAIIASSVVITTTSTT